MKLLRPRSLQLRLAARLGSVFFAATVIVVSSFFYLTYQLAEELSRRDLVRLAEELAREVDENGNFGSLDRVREWDLLKDESAFAILDENGRILAASSDDFSNVAIERSRATSRRKIFRLPSFGIPSQPYYGLESSQTSKIGQVAIIVAEPENAKDEILNAMFEEIAPQVALIFPFFIVVTLAVGIFAIRSGLRPLRETAAQAGTITPDALSVRLSTEDLPTEVSPLVNAVNRALDRLEEGFAVQRQFTANAAHELRTPLAIITGALHELGPDSELAKLQQDVNRMNRLVQQLLNVARLDGTAINVSQAVDLRACARKVVEYLAPLVFEQERTIALVGSDHPVVVMGNSYAIEDALRNLIENALTHAFRHTEIVVTVFDEGKVSVCNEGPVIASQHREHIFERFWRDSKSTGTGAGLGLAIVNEIMEKHRGSVTISDYSMGGACFTLSFPSSLS